MKANRLRWLLLFLLVGSVFQLPAQQSEADRKLLADIRTKAEKGDLQSQFELGKTFYNGRLGVAKDYVEAVKWFRKAAEQSVAEAQFNLGLCYERGRGVVKDEAEAVKWYRKAAEQNCPDAQYNLGVCCKKGRGVAKDVVEAVKWYRKAAEQNYAEAQKGLGVCYHDGEGVAKDYVEAVKWFRKAAEQNYAEAQYNLGLCYLNGEGVVKDEAEAIKWYRRAAEQNLAAGQCGLGGCYYYGQGVVKDYAEAVKWFRKAVEQNDAEAQYNLGLCYVSGEGVAKDYVEAYKWWLLAGVRGVGRAKRGVVVMESVMSGEQIAQGRKLAQDFKPKEVLSAGGDGSDESIRQTGSESTGTGFFITEDGYLVTNGQLVGEGADVRLVTRAGYLHAKVVKTDVANDLALLKAEGKFAALPVVSSRTVKTGNMVATVGFPNMSLQGFTLKLAKGEIASLSGSMGDPKYFQISVPLQPGNSGGALVDERGNVVGVVAAKLNVTAALATSGSLPENVNYAVKSSSLLSFLESVPDVSAKLKEPNAKDAKFEDVVKSAEKAAVLVLVY